MNYIIAGVLMVVAIILFVLVFGTFWTIKLWSTPSKSHLENTINNSSYFYRLNKYDLLAREADSHELYIIKYKKSLKMFSKEESSKLSKLIDDITTKYMNKYEKLQTIPWLIVKF